MDIIEQVCSLEQAKELKALGVIQKSLFYHHPQFDKPVFGETRITKHEQSGNAHSTTSLCVCNDKKDSYSAYTVAELGKFLELITDQDDLFFTHSYNNHFGQFTTVISERSELAKDGFEILFEMEDGTEAGSRADTLTHLLMSKLVSVDIINNTK